MCTKYGAVSNKSRLLERLILEWRCEGLKAKQQVKVKGTEKMCAYFCHKVKRIYFSSIAFDTRV